MCAPPFLDVWPERAGFGLDGLIQAATYGFGGVRIGGFGGFGSFGSGFGSFGCAGARTSIGAGIVDMISSL